MGAEWSCKSCHCASCGRYARVLTSVIRKAYWCAPCACASPHSAMTCPASCTTPRARRSHARPASCAAVSQLVIKCMRGPFVHAVSGREAMPEAPSVLSHATRRCPQRTPASVCGSTGLWPRTPYRTAGVDGRPVIVVCLDSIFPPRRQKIHPHGDTAASGMRPRSSAPA
jgi:hypothetical protein